MLQINLSTFELLMFVLKLLQINSIDRVYFDQGTLSLSENATPVGWEKGHYSLHLLTAASSFYLFILFFHFTCRLDQQVLCKFWATET